MPPLHTPTLLLANVTVVVLCALLMFYSWWRGRQERTLLWGSGMLLAEGVGLVLNSARGLGFDWVALGLGNMVLLLSIALNWTALRVFCGRQAYWPGILFGAASWALLCQWPAFYGDFQARVAALTLLLSGYMLMTLIDLWRVRHIQQVSLFAVQLLIVCHVLFYLFRLLLGPWLPEQTPWASPMFNALLIECMLYAVASAFVMISLVKERAELQNRSAANTDPLTGIGNRRAFVDSSEQLLQHCAERGAPVALLLCDLDHFKAINDSLGHAEGDRVLQAFSAGAACCMRKSDVFGRVGGEEFACLIPGTLEEAMRLAERIRAGFSASGAHSVSIGACSSADAGYDLTRLLSLADQALYRAKDEGRDRVRSFAAGSEPEAVLSR